MTHTPQWISLRALDQAASQPKGTAFRAFKALETTLIEGSDFCVLDHARDAGRIAEMKQAQQIYASSVQVILLTPATAQIILQSLTHSGEV